jgi:mono/diheme cytochrome c family protein
MKRPIAFVVTIAGVLLASVSIAQMGMGRGMGSGMMAHGPQGVSMLRHRFVMANGIDPQYARSRNPLAATQQNLHAGKVLFERNCASCHGATGRGNGPAAKGLNPAPADLTVVMRRPIAGDAYLDWTISEGGVPIQSAMPPFKSTLSRDQIWKLVLYLRTL